jgi:hypothetical protein
LGHSRALAFWHCGALVLALCSIGT